MEVLKSSNSYSAVMDVKGRKMVERDFAVQARLAQHRKDVEMILAEGQATGRVWPLSTLHRELLLLAERSNLGDVDNSAVIEAISRASREAT